MDYSSVEENPDFQLLFEGEVKGYKPHGQGKMLYHGGNTIEGKWEQGSPVGPMKLSYKNKERYSGELKDLNRYGAGDFTFANGDKYRGSWENDLRHGKAY